MDIFIKDYHHPTAMKQISNSLPTIFDVAKLSGVSRRTVDRVIHEKGRVSQETIKKVRKAIKELGYSPNPAASSLANKKEYKLACLIPEYTKGDYWDEIKKGFIEGAESIKFGSVLLDIHLYDHIDVDSFIRASKKVIESNPSGVMMNVVFEEAVANFAAELSAKRIPYAFVSNMIDDENHSLYYGTDLYKSGKLGAYLLTARSKVTEIALIRIIRDAKHKADPNALRRHGFLDYIEEHIPDCKIHTVFIDPDKPEDIQNTLETFFREHPNVKHVGITHSRVWLIDKFLEANPDPERIVIGFDDLEKNLECLRKGHIEFLITRHISQQSYITITEFAEYIIRGTLPTKRNNFVHIDILHQYNLDGY